MPAGPLQTQVDKKVGKQRKMFREISVNCTYMMLTSKLSQNSGDLEAVLAKLFFPNKPAKCTEGAKKKKKRDIGRY